MNHADTKVYVQYPSDALAITDGLDTINTHDATTLDQLFRERVRRSSDEVAYTQYNNQQDRWESFTWADVAYQVERWQVAMRDAGLVKGDRVAICYRNSLEWVVFDQAALRLGLVVVPLYTADRPDNLAYVLGHSGSRLVLLEHSSLWQSIVDTDENVDCVEVVIAFNGDVGGSIRLVDHWLPEQGQHFERGLAEPDDLASIIYTSGTTGRPKGVMLTHRNLLSNAYNGMRSVALKPTDRLLSFLPLSHALERTVGYYAALLSGSAVTFNRSIPDLAEDLREVRPTVLISVPRIFERIHNQIYTELEHQSAWKQWVFRSAIDAGWRRFLYDQRVAGWHPRLLFAGLFDSLVAKSIRDKLGGQLEFVVVGGAPLSEAVARTFLSLGVPLLQGYGLTEASPVVSVNTLSKNRPNSIGMLLRGVAAKLMDNDELWVRGENVMQGNWQNPQASNATIVEEAGERWLKTGDRASIDEHGFIRIIGRIKDILVLANGEKVPPSDIEAAIIQNPLFEQALVIGEGKSFLSALVVLNAARFHQLCQDNGWLETDLTSALLQDYLVQEIANRMEDFPGYAKVRKVTVCAEEWTIESGLLTPTLKKKRSKIIQHYQQTIAAMYDGHGVHAS